MEGDVSWIISLRRFVPSFKQESHRSSTDDISESFRAEKGINIRKEDQKFIGKKSRLWQKLSFNQVVARYVARLPIDLRAKALKNIVLYQLGFISHFAYNKATRDINSHAPKLNLYSVELRKWMDSSYHGLPLHSAYFDLVLNRGKRGWTTVLRQPFQSSRGQINHSIFVSVNEDDLTFLLSVCPIGMWNIELVQRRFKGSAGEMNAMMSRVPDFKTPDSQKGFQKACFFEMFGISASDFGLF
jgi:hypothetical protein